MMGQPELITIYRRDFGCSQIATQAAQHLHGRSGLFQLDRVEDRIYLAVVHNSDLDQSISGCGWHLVSG